MPDNNSTTTKFKVDISELKKGIQDANRQIRLANAEFKAASAGMEDWGKSADGVQKKIEQLDKVLESQKKILESYESQLELISKEYGANSKEADEMRIKIANQQAAVASTTADLEKYKKILSGLEDEQKKAADGAERQGKAYDDLKGSVKDQQERLNALKEEYKQVVVEQGKNSDSAKDLAKQIDSLSGELADSKKTMDDADKAADDLDRSLDDAGKSAKDAQGGFTVLKGVLADLASTAIKAVVSGLKDMAKAAGDAWKEFDAGRDTIIKMTGATGDMAAALTKSYGNVSKEIVADSADVAGAIGEVNTRFGLTGEDLEKLALQYVKFSQVTDSEVISSIDDTQKALAAYGKGAEEAAGFLDALTKTSQQTGVDTGTLTNGIVSNATAFQELGLSLEQAVAFMGQLETSGVNSETVLNGMRKALKNSAKEGLSLDESLKALQTEIENGNSSMDGLNAAYDLFGKSGDQIYGAIKNGTLSFEDLTSAVTDAGGAVENTYGETLDATDEIRLEIQKLKISAAEFIDEFIRDNKDEIKDFLDKALEGIKNLAKLLPKLLPVLVSIGAALGAFKIVTLVTTLVSAFQKFFAVVKAGQGIMAALNAVMAVNPIALIVAAIAALVAGFIYLWNTSEEFRNFWIGLWEGIKNAALGIVEWFTDIFNGIVDFFKNNWQSILLFLINPFAGLFKYCYDNFEGFRKFVDGIIESIKNFFADLWNGIKTGAEAAWNFVTGIWTAVGEWFKSNVIDPVTGFFSDAWEKLKNGASEAWEGIKNVFSKVAEFFGNIFSTAWEKVKNVFSTGGKIFDGIKEGITEAFKTVVNAIIKGINKVVSIPFTAINKALDVIRDVSIAGVKPFAGLIPSIAVPEIPLLAKGGVLAKGQVGLLEGTGAEAVVPLDENKKWVAAVAADLRQALAADGLLGFGGEAGIQQGSTYTFIQNNNSPKALDRLEIYRQTRNQLELAKGV